MCPYKYSISAPGHVLQPRSALIIQEEALAIRCLKYLLWLVFGRAAGWVGLRIDEMLGASELSRGQAHPIVCCWLEMSFSRRIQASFSSGCDIL